ncbi:MAG: hypothetical protein QM658_03395 [Gordonia sp. (in: high G+C Gram-positive bacteria)]
MDREAFERQHGRVRDRQLALRREAMKALSDAHREQLRADALVLYQAQQIIQRSYSPWWSDRGVAAALREVEAWLGNAARSGDGAAAPPDLGEFLR